MDIGATAPELSCVNVGPIVPHPRPLCPCSLKDPRMCPLVRIPRDLSWSPRGAEIWVRASGRE
eukprot:7868514-Alexandrium_andersonii.AAC.1